MGDEQAIPSGENALKRYGKPINGTVQHVWTVIKSGTSLCMTWKT